MKTKKIICIICPLGCQMEVYKNEKSENFIVSGNGCQRGEHYGIKEMTNPTRILTSSVKLTNSILKRLPVRTDKPIAKDMILKCMVEIKKLEAVAPIEAGAVLIKDVFNTGVNIISSKSVYN